MLERKTGLFEAKFPNLEGSKGLFYIRDGQLYDAWFGELLGVEAAQVMLRNDKAIISIRTKPKKANIKRRIETTLMSLLMESARQPVQAEPSVQPGPEPSNGDGHADPDIKSRETSGSVVQTGETWETEPELELAGEDWAKPSGKEESAPEDAPDVGQAEPSGTTGQEPATGGSDDVLEDKSGEVGDSEDQVDETWEVEPELEFAGEDWADVSGEEGTIPEVVLDGVPEDEASSAGEGEKRINKKPTILGEKSIMGKFAKALQPLKDVDGFQGAGIFSPDGEMIDSFSISGQNLAEIGALANDILLKSQKTTEVMGVGRGNQVHIQAPKAHILVRCLNEATDFSASSSGRAHIHMAMIMEPEGNLAFAKMKLESVIKELAPSFR